MDVSLLPHSLFIPMLLLSSVSVGAFISYFDDKIASLRREKLLFHLLRKDRPDLKNVRPPFHKDTVIRIYLYIFFLFLVSIIFAFFGHIGYLHYLSEYLHNKLSLSYFTLSKESSFPFYVAIFMGAAFSYAIYCRFQLLSYLLLFISIRTRENPLISLFYYFIRTIIQLSPLFVLIFILFGLLTTPSTSYYFLAFFIWSILVNLALLHVFNMPLLYNNNNSISPLSVTNPENADVFSSNEDSTSYASEKPYHEFYRLMREGRTMLAWLIRLRLYLWFLLARAARAFKTDERNDWSAFFEISKIMLRLSGYEPDFKNLNLESIVSKCNEKNGARLVSTYAAKLIGYEKYRKTAIEMLQKAITLSSSPRHIARLKLTLSFCKYVLSTTSFDISERIKLLTEAKYLSEEILANYPDCIILVNNLLCYNFAIFYEIVNLPPSSSPLDITTRTSCDSLVNDNKILLERLERLCGAYQKRYKSTIPACIHTIAIGNIMNGHLDKAAYLLAFLFANGQRLHQAEPTFHLALLSTIGSHKLDTFISLAGGELAQKEISPVLFDDIYSTLSEITKIRNDKLKVGTLNDISEFIRKLRASLHLSMTKRLALSPPLGFNNCRFYHIPTIIQATSSIQSATQTYTEIRSKIIGTIIQVQVPSFFIFIIKWALWTIATIGTLCLNMVLLSFNLTAKEKWSRKIWKTMLDLTSTIDPKSLPVPNLGEDIA